MKKLPIGYYLKKTDNLLTDRINKIHSEWGLTRTEWQLLNAIYEGVDKSTLLTQLAVFASTEQLIGTITELIKRGLVIETPTLKLTDEGERTFRNCLQKQTALRQQSMQNISEQEYRQLITTLEKMIDNLEKTN